MSDIMRDSRKPRLPEIPASDESFHLLHLEDVRTIFPPEKHKTDDTDSDSHDPNPIPIRLVGNDISKSYYEHIERKDYPGHIAPCPVDEDSRQKTENDIAKGLEFFSPEGNHLLQKGQHHEDETSQIIGIPQRREDAMCIDSSLVERCQRIEPYLLENRIQNHTSQTDAGEDHETFPFGA